MSDAVKIEETLIHFKLLDTMLAQSERCDSQGQGEPESSLVEEEPSRKLKDGQ